MNISHKWVRPTAQGDNFMQPIEREPIPAFNQPRRQQKVFKEGVAVEIQDIILPPEAIHEVRIAQSDDPMEGPLVEFQIKTTVNRSAEFRKFTVGTGEPFTVKITEGEKVYICTDMFLTDLQVDVKEGVTANLRTASQLLITDIPNTQPLPPLEPKDKIEKLVVDDWKMDLNETDFKWSVDPTAQGSRFILDFWISETESEDFEVPKMPVFKVEYPYLHLKFKTQSVVMRGKEVIIDGKKFEMSRHMGILVEEKMK